MPNIKSAKKRVLVAKTKAAQNKGNISALRTMIKKAELAIQNNDENKVEIVRTAVKAIDQASANGLVHKNCAARKKSQLANKLNQAG